MRIELYVYEDVNDLSKEEVESKVLEQYTDKIRKVAVVTSLRSGTPGSNLTLWLCQLYPKVIKK